MKLKWFLSVNESWMNDVKGFKVQTAKELCYKGFEDLNESGMNIK